MLQVDVGLFLLDLLGRLVLDVLQSRDLRLLGLRFFGCGRSGLLQLEVDAGRRFLFRLRDRLRGRFLQLDRGFRFLRFRFRFRFLGLGSLPGRPSKETKSMSMKVFWFRHCGRYYKRLKIEKL